MKKGVKFAFLSLVLTMVGSVPVLAGYNFGPDNIFHMEAKSGVSLRGCWTEGTMSNGTKAAYDYYKQVYAREGDGGTYSDWAPKTKPSITHRDYGSFSSDYAEVRGYWKQ